MCLWDVEAKPTNGKLDPQTRFRFHQDVLEDVTWHSMHETLFATVGDDKLMAMYVISHGCSEKLDGTSEIPPMLLLPLLRLTLQLSTVLLSIHLTRSIAVLVPLITYTSFSEPTNSIRPLRYGTFAT